MAARMAKMMHAVRQRVLADATADSATAAALYRAAHAVQLNQ
jgi:hypothetical protein